MPSPSTIEVWSDCALARGSGSPGHCGWCGGPARRDTAWCGTVCEDAYATNHEWERARFAVLARDRERCTHCERGPSTAAEAKVVIRALIPMGPVEAARLWHSPAWWAFELACSVDVVSRHRVADRYRSGCHHHLDALETRCRACQEQAQRQAG